MDTQCISKVSDFVVKYKPYIIYGTNLAFLRQATELRFIAALKAMRSNPEYRMRIIKQQLIEKELSKPYFEKLYEMSERGY